MGSMVFEAELQIPLSWHTRPNSLSDRK